MGLGSDPETIKDRVELPCDVYVSEYMVQNYPEIAQDLLNRGCTFVADKEAPLYFSTKSHLEAVKILLYT